MGGSKTLKRERDQSLAQQSAVFAQMNQPTPEVLDFRNKKAAWDEWIAGKNYSKPPDGSMLNFDLFLPSYENRQKERLADLTGIGAAALGGTGDQSVALQLARERNANERAMQSAANYEGAVKAQDSYFKGNQLAFADFDMQRMAHLLGNATQRGQYYSQAYQQSKPMNSFIPMLLGGALQAGSALLGNPGLFKKP